ncbi:oxidoreductase [Burkholderia sp. IDO3]|uniref:oxidoreductase n=1 Tax=Burkholderia sp. IDO3 TaxID=1705310 RepID=UPI000BBA565F|nr:oxidoreductase [Burkholderia sp. IDO3]AXK62705.1 SDR family NAD(P)-dependent oxidoreductase [Burkholderia sp. IDO3]PCD63378.1 short-chain dehydrogenase/reductase [Burkholderia sp. IDO3]
MTTTTHDKPVWFITGCSTGFGHEIARKTLGLGYPTVVTARNPDSLAGLAREFGELALVLPLDVTQPAQIDAATRAALARFGRVDVLVNNAGIGYFGSFEESERDEVRKMFDINVWGLADMTRALLPTLRKQRAGTIVNISSVGGIVASPGVGFYNATKFAVEALSESLAQELAPLGVKVLIVEPGPFRTDWAGRSANQAPQTLDDYAATAKLRTDTIRGYSGKQPGDPARAADAIVKMVESDDAPLRLLLGKVALTNANRKLDALRHDFDGWADVSRGADYPDA